jgi:hypothetical protein
MRPHANNIVSIKIYDLSGHLTATLLDKPMNVGRHYVSWNTRNMASGCYLVNMTAGSHTQVKSIPLFR